MTHAIPKKSLGQNFLRAPAVAEEIAKAACPNVDETVLEIGPGEGALTDALLRHAGKVIAVEKDARLVAPLKEKYATEIKGRKLILREGDFLDLSVEMLVGRRPYVVAANIPYYITGAIIRRVFEVRRKPSRVVLLVQKEVAERIVAKGGKPLDSARGKESILSMSVKVFGDPRIVRKVPAGAFHPRPKVDSAVIAIENIRTPFETAREEKKFFDVVKRGFAHKRKFLRRNLGISAEALLRAGVSEDARAEDLSAHDWLRLVRAL